MIFLRNLLVIILTLITLVGLRSKSKQNRNSHISINRLLIQLTYTSVF